MTALDGAYRTATRTRAPREKAQGSGPIAAATLAQLIEGEIIPRLLIAHRDDPRAAPLATGATRIEPGDVDTLAPMVLREDTWALLRHVETFLARGVPVHTVFVELLAPVARRLGEYWEADACDFIDVTMGLWRMQEIVREVGARTPGVPSTGIGRAALFAPVPGEQHSFGSVMVEELFRRSGWTTANAAGDADGSAGGNLMDVAARRPFDLIGLTASCTANLAGLPVTIAALRRASHNPSVVIMLGGAAVCGDPAIAEAAGADGTAANAGLALSRAEQLIADGARRASAA